MKPAGEKRPLRILLADDGSQHSLAAIALVKDLALPEGSSISVAGVLTPHEISNHSLLEAVLEQAGSLLSETGVPVHQELLFGQPAESLVRYAEEFHPNLVVMGAKGLRATLGILLGGVAQQIVEYANWPVLVVRSPYNGLNRVLLTTDGSPPGLHAEQFVSGDGDCAPFPFPAHTRLEVMHVLPPLVTPEHYIQSLHIGPDLVLPIRDGELDKEIARLAEEEECTGREILEQSIRRLGEAGIPARQVLKRGDAATEIIDYAREQQMDLLIAGSRGLGQVRGWLLGSVSRKLVHYAPCSVLIVKSRVELG